MTLLSDGDKIGVGKAAIAEGDAMTATKRKQINMTEGKLFGKIFFFILPIVATNLLQVLYNAADMMIVGMSSEADAVGAIGITGSFVSLIVGVFMGFATGSNVMVARHLGAKDDKNVSNTVHTSIIMSVMFGIAGGIIGFFVSRPILALMGAEGKLLDLATTYTQIYFAGVPFIAVTNYVIAIFRAKGDTKTPLFVLMGSGILNVLLNLFFVLTFNLSVEGVSMATAISNAAAAAVLLLILAKDESPCRFSFKLLKFDKRAFSDICRIGLPAGIQGALFSISNMLIQSSILQVNNAMAPIDSPFQPVVKGNAAATNLEGFAYNTQNAVYQAAITFTSQNAGAGKPKRVWRVMACCYLITLVISVVITTAMIAFNEPLLALYDVVDGAEGTLEHIAYQTGLMRMKILFTTYFLIAFMEVGCGIVRGLGHSGASTIICLLGSCVLRIVWVAFVFKADPTFETVMLSYPISWFLTASALFGFGVVALRRLIRRVEAEKKRSAQETAIA